MQRLRRWQVSFAIAGGVQAVHSRTNRYDGFKVLFVSSEADNDRVQNLSPYYSAMSMARSLIDLLQAWESGQLPQIQLELLQEKVIPTLFQCLIRTLQSQRTDGAWSRKGPREETSYAVLTLVNLYVLPLAQHFHAQMRSGIDRGRSFLKGSDAQKPEYLWIEKVTYGSTNLAETYILVASNAPIDEPLLEQPIHDLCSVPVEGSTGFESLIIEQLYRRNLSG